MFPARPTLGDVARVAGVHKATASRALNPVTAHRVHAETARRVVAAAEQLDYRPNINARGLRAGSTKTVGVLIPDVLSQLYPPMIRGIEDVLRESEHFALVADTQSDTDQERRALDNLLARQVDGLIVGTHTSSRSAIVDAAAHGTPVVYLGDVDDVPGVAIVAGDLRAGVDALADLLVASGHRRIAYVGVPPGTGDGARRAELHRLAFARLGLDPAHCHEVVAAAIDADAGQEATARLLAERPDVTAVMAYNDLVAIGALRAIRAAGLRCPDDVTVTGFNDIPLVGELTPPLTTVRLDTLRQGREAAEVLMGMIMGHHGPPRRIVPTVLVPRASHGPARSRR